MDAKSSSDATRGGDAEQYYLEQLMKHQADRDAALEVAQGRVLPGRSTSPSKGAGAARKQSQPGYTKRARS